MIWGLVSLECYLDIHMDMPGWQVDTKTEIQERTGIELQI